jgi:hypothetical protein
MWSLAGIQSLPQEDQDGAWTAVRKELQSHLDNDTLIEVAKLPTETKGIKTRGFLIRKPVRVDGEIRYKFKYRLVVCGCSQDDTHFDKSDSPVISMCALQCSLFNVRSPLVLGSLCFRTVGLVPRRLCHSVSQELH